MAFEKHLLKSKISENKQTVAEIAEKLGITPSAYYRKVRNGGDFSREEIDKLIDVLNISDPKAIFFSR